MVIMELRLLPPHLLFFLLTTPEQSLRSCCHYQLMQCSGDASIFSFPIMDTHRNPVLWMAQHRVQLLHCICWRIKRVVGVRMCPIIVFLNDPCKVHIGSGLL